jgi:DNA-binding XRE family transcriptional regulator
MLESVWACQQRSFCSERIEMSDLTGAQVRMARAFLRWSMADLAKRAKVGTSTVQAIEATDGVPEVAAGIRETREHRAAERAVTVDRVRAALVAAGITFLQDDGKGGVGVRGKHKAK